MKHDSAAAIAAKRMSKARRSFWRSLVLMLGGRRAVLDTLVLAAVVIAIGVVAAEIDALESLVRWAHQYEDYEVDEVFTTLIVSSFALSIFAVRRIAELRAEVRRRDRAERQIRHMALHDALTGLPNRVLFKELLEQELNRAMRDGSHIAVFALDLDNFKRVNDVYGHAVGDALLRAVAERFRETVRKMDTVARLGGDEFVIIQPSLTQPQGWATLAARLLEVLSKPLDVAGRQIVTNVSIGVALSSTQPQDGGELLRYADIALYRAKADGRSTYRFFDDNMGQMLRDRRALERDLRQAVAREELELHYQPWFNTKDCTLAGFEALLRWSHRERGAISPAEFIPIAEETGIILRLGEWVLERACGDAMRWPGNYTVAVNLSPAQFKHPDLPTKLKATLDKTGLPTNRLELEITESALTEDSEHALKILQDLKAIGVNIAIQDFGAGYSSLICLRCFRFDKIKIDRSFVRQMEADEAGAAIVSAVLAMGRSLGTTATAEGIESAGQLSCLGTEHCDHAQGFLLGKPMPFDRARSLCEHYVGKAL